MGKQRFKVGDWVRVKLGQGTALLRENNIYEVLGHSDRKYPIVAVTCSHGDRHELDYEPERFTLYRSASTPEKPATLKIAEGKFYKTRDGRKVGPMVRWSQEVEHPWEQQGGSAVFDKCGDIWRDDGSSEYDVPPLIAEWIDEPVAKVGYDAWFREKVQESLDGKSPRVAHADVMQSIKSRRIGASTASNDNAKPKFKVGDLIRHKSLDLKGFVKEVIDARTVRTHWPKVGWGGADPIDSIELITTPTAIVALIENGQPKPSSTPHVHTSEVAAHKEAGRLAAKYKGQQFGVFTLTATHKEERVYEHKWQNMAALGLKVDAIKELRAVAGLDLLSAKRAVEAFEQAA